MIIEEDDFDKFNDPEFMKKAKQETLAKKARIEQRRQEETEELERLYDEP